MQCLQEELNSSCENLQIYFSSRKSFGWRPRKWNLSRIVLKEESLFEDKENVAPDNSFSQTDSDTSSIYDDFTTPAKSLRFNLHTPDSCFKPELSSNISFSEDEEDELEISRLRRIVRQRDEEIVKLKSRIAELEMSLRDSIQKTPEFVTPRMKVKVARNPRMNHNVLSVKDCISIFCRVRPLTDQERSKLTNTVDPFSLMKFNDDNTGSLEIMKPLSEMYTQDPSNVECMKYQFVFDKVFKPFDSQQNIFSELEDSVEKVVEQGFRCTVLCYGQTGSGKTYTIQGCDDEPGLLQRSVDHLFQLMDCSMFVQVLFVEIYNEDTRDLLKDVTYKRKACSFNQDELYITANSKEHVYQLIEKARENRAIAQTENNKRSSRSHCVFRFRVVCGDSMTQVGTINLIDLAGSERLSETMDFITADNTNCGESVADVKKQRKSETLSINKSLSALSQVIKAMCDGQSFVDYRSSTLTQLLKDDLSYHQQSVDNNDIIAKSRVHMIVNIKPPTDPKRMDRTIGSLQFAKRASTFDFVKQNKLSMQQVR